MMFFAFVLNQDFNKIYRINLSIPENLIELVILGKKCIFAKILILINLLNFMIGLLQNG